MKKNMLLNICLLLLLLGSAQSALAAIEGKKYTIQTSVISGGAAYSISNNYELSSTVSQSSPLMNPDNPPYSTSYDLYPGFWYTIDLILVRVKAMPWLILLMHD